VTWRCAAHQPRVAPFHLRFHPLLRRSFRVSLPLSSFFPPSPSLLPFLFLPLLRHSRAICTLSFPVPLVALLSRSPPSSSSSSSSSSTRIEYSYFSLRWPRECSRAPFSATFPALLVLSLPPISRGCNFPCPESASPRDRSFASAFSRFIRQTRRKAGVSSYYVKLGAAESSSHPP